MVNVTLSKVTALITPLLVCIVTGCTQVTARHNPLYRASPHDSEIQATAQNDTFGISNISINVISGAMTDCSGFSAVHGMNTRSITPCRVGAIQTTNACTFAGAPTAATCTVTIPIEADTMVSYIVTVVAGNGIETTLPEISYSGGTLSQQRIARPVYWHRQQMRGSRIDLGAFPDFDYRAGLAVSLNPYRHFTDDLTAIFNGAFFNTTDSFASRYTADRQFFNLWAGPFGANAEGCSRSFNGDAMAVSAVMDGSTILHRNAFRDCASLTAGGGGAGSVEASANDPAWLLTHESGHFLFQLSDEYDGGGYDATLSCPNVYSSMQTCQSAAPSVGAAATQCAKIGSQSFWRIVTTNETMSDRVLNSDLRDDAERCFTTRISSCSNGMCY
jgi:hypothetical protein